MTERRMFTAGFIGDADVTEENAADLLDKYFLPEYNTDEFCLMLPTDIRRTQTGLRAVLAAITSDLSLEVTRASVGDMMTQLVTEHASANPDVYLVVLVDESTGASDDLIAIIEKAIDAGIPVKNLCALLDDVELADEPEPEGREDGPDTDPDQAETDRLARQYGQPRATEPAVVEAIVEGPATPAPMAQGLSLRAIDKLAEAISELIQEEITKMGLSIGHNTRQTDMHPQDVKVKEGNGTVRAFKDKDGNLELAPEGTQRAPKGKTSVQLSQDEAAKAGLTQ